MVGLLLASQLAITAIAEPSLGSRALRQSQASAESIDLRPWFERFGLAPRQQGQRGACQVFAMVTVAEYLEAKKGRRVDFSEQFLMAAANRANALNRTDGFNPDLLIKGWKEYGIVSEGVMPYVPRNEAIGVPPPTVWRDAAAYRNIKVTQIKHWSSDIGFSEANMRAILAELRQGRPVTVTLCWPFGLKDSEIVDQDNFLIDKNIDGTDKSGHGVALVGFAIDQNVRGGGYFWLRNSWSSAFADKGYAKIDFEMARRYGTDAYIVEVVR